MSSNPSLIAVPPQQAGRRLDQFLVGQLAQAQVLVDEKTAKASLRLRGGEQIRILGRARSQPRRAVPEDIALDLVYEDSDLAVIDKPAGMMVHAGAGASDAERNRGTLVNALLYRFGQLSGLGGELRPGIVHRLDRATSGLIVVAKNDEAHRRLALQFSRRQVRKTYLALVHGWLRQDQGTIARNISRDLIRRTRMTTRRSGGREAITHYRVRQRIESIFGKFSVLELNIETGRTHQIRVHLASLGHPVVGDSQYGAPREIKARIGSSAIALNRNFLHATALSFTHPRTSKPLSFERPLPNKLMEVLEHLAGRRS